MNTAAHTYIHIVNVQHGTRYYDTSDRSNNSLTLRQVEIVFDISGTCKNKEFSDKN